MGFSTLLNSYALVFPSLQALLQEAEQLPSALLFKADGSSC